MTDENVERLDSEIKKLQDEKEKYIENKRKEKFVNERSDDFMNRLHKMRPEGFSSDIENDMEDVRSWFEHLFSQLYESSKDKMYINYQLEQKFDESITILKGRKKLYSDAIDILIESLEKLKNKEMLKNKKQEM